MPLILPRHLKIQLHLIDYIERNVKLFAPDADVKLSMLNIGGHSSHVFEILLSKEDTKVLIAYEYEGGYYHKGTDIVRVDTLKTIDLKTLETISVTQLHPDTTFMTSARLAHEVVKRLLQKETP